MENSEKRKIKLLLQATQQDVYIEYLFGPLNLPFFLEVFQYLSKSVKRITFFFSISGLQENIFCGHNAFE